MRMERILVTGATGFIGIEISRQLASRGLKPRLMVRRPLRGLMLKHLDVEIMQADLRSPRSLIRALDGIDTIFHLGARAAFESYTRLYPSIVGGSKNLMLANNVFHTVQSQTVVRLHNVTGSAVTDNIITFGKGGNAVAQTGNCSGNYYRPIDPKNSAPFDAYTE